MGNICCCYRKNTKKKIVILLVGLDNAGKTVAAKSLAREPLDSVIPTVGFSVIDLKYLNYHIKMFDLGGGPNIRGIWHKYFVNAHGVIFVVDSSDYSRITEAKSTLTELISHEKIAGKPLLILANKQDNENALDEIDIIEQLDIETLANNQKSPTLVKTCSATELVSNKIDQNIQNGFDWLVNYIIRHYEMLNERVEADSFEQEREDNEELLKKIERIKNLQKMESSQTDVDVIESYSDYARKLSAKPEDKNEVRPIQVESEESNDTDTSSISFPSVYHTELSHEVSRPSSAVEIVKQQIQMNYTRQKTFIKHDRNKTHPVHLFGDREVHRRAFSAGYKRKSKQEERRLRSAGNSETIFTISNKNFEIFGGTGDEVANNIIEMKTHRVNGNENSFNLNGVNKNLAWVHKPFNGDNSLSVVEID